MKYISKSGRVHVAHNDVIFVLTAKGLSVEFRVFENATQARTILALYEIVPLDHPIELWETVWDKVEDRTKRVRLISSR